MGLLDLCEKYFATSNLYEVLQISENATEKEVKKAYHKLSLKVHPDRVNDDEKLEATEKFKVLGSVHSILSDKDKRTLYDETKSVDDDEYNVIKDKDWTIYWRLLFKKITEEDIKAYEKEYIGSEDERKDLKNAYLSGKGDMDIIVDRVQFARSEHEPRLRGILTVHEIYTTHNKQSFDDMKILHSKLRTVTIEMIEQGEIPAYKIFTHEPARKTQKRHAKENREAQEAEELKKAMGLKSDDSNNLELMIKQRQEARGKQIDSFIDDLAEKYGGKSRATKRKATKEAGTKNKRKK